MKKMTRNIAESESDNLNPYPWQYVIPQTSSLPSFSPPMILFAPEYLLSTPHLHPATLARGVAAIDKINLVMTKY